MSSKIIKIRRDIDYLNETDIKYLYNCYGCAFEGFSVKILKSLKFPYQNISSIQEFKSEDTITLLSEFNFYIKMYDSVDKRNVKMPHNIVHLNL